VDRYLSSFKSTYDLDAEQLKQVRDRLEQLKVKELEYIEIFGEKRRKLGSELYELWHKRRNDEEVDGERMRELMEELGRIRRNSPLMSWDNATGEIEKLLPTEQVAKGRQRMEERRRDYEQRRDDMRWLNKVERGLRADPSEKDSWDRYLEDFVRKFQLDDSQQSTALSILRTFKQRRDAYRESRRDEYKALLSLEDFNKRDKQLESLRGPVNRLFSDLQTKLERIPTSAQKALVLRTSPKLAQTQPAESSTQPSGSATQPSKLHTALRPRD
jgi:hypothetical protein